MAVRRPRPEYLSGRSRKTSDPLVAVRDGRKNIGRRVYLQARLGWRTNGKLTDLFGFSGYCLA